jgi:glutamate/tyrosine decarboxylase-like PLP-dependent enzyme
MENTWVIEITNPKAKDLLEQLEELNWIKVLNEGSAPPVSMELKKFRGILTKEQGKELQKHIQTIRNEWGDT